MKPAGMPLLRSISPATLLCWRTKLVCDSVGVLVTLLTVLLPRLVVGVMVAADAAGAVAPLAAPIWRVSCWAIRSDKPPGWPDMATANCWSSKSVPKSVPALSSMPDFMVASRMLLSSSRMNRDSNCLAVSLIDSGVWLPACILSLPRAFASAASAVPLDMEEGP